MLLMFFVSMYAKLFYISVYFISLLGIVIMSVGLQYALLIKRDKTIKKLKKEVQHDMILYQYYRSRRQARIVINRQLVNMAWINIQLSRYDFAQMALGRLEIESCNAIELQQIYFLQMIVATEKREKQKAQEWYIRYKGVNLEAKDGTTCQEIVLQKQYTDNNYETRIVDFYLVNPQTKKVTDEHKKTW